MFGSNIGKGRMNLYPFLKQFRKGSKFIHPLLILISKFIHPLPILEPNIIKIDTLIDICYPLDVNAIYTHVYATELMVDGGEITLMVVQ